KQYTIAIYLRPSSDVGYSAVKAKSISLHFISSVEVGGFHQNGKRKELHHKQATQGVDYRAYYTQKWDRLFERAWV
ncbi:unnamed protein product, partial [Callosobruchus maculatus]